MILLLPVSTGQDCGKSDWLANKKKKDVQARHNVFKTKAFRLFLSIRSRKQ